MHLKRLELSGFKSFAKKSEFVFNVPISAIVGPNGSGKSNVAEAFRFVLGEQSIKSMRGKKGEDLIWGGSEQVPRANRASAKVVFDNRKKLFDLDFDEVSVERVVHRDGVNQYLINGSQVRLRDVTEMLANANIGSSGHHIISQGESDRILRASPRERREMIEDALGLRAYQYKLRDSEGKLEKTKENIGHVQSLRREIAPHLKFLKRQVEKIEKTLSLQGELEERYREYLKREEVYLTKTREMLAEKRRGPEEQLAALERDLAKAKKTLDEREAGSGESAEADKLDERLRTLREEKDALVRDLGRLEGQIAAAEKSAAHARAREGAEQALSITKAELETLREEIDEYVREGASAEDVTVARSALEKIRSLIQSFFERHERPTSQSADGGEDDLAVLQEKQKELENALAKLTEEQRDVEKRYADIRKAVETAKDESREAERRVFEIRAKQQELRGALSDIAHHEERLERDKETFDRELSEGTALIGKKILVYQQHGVDESAVMKEPRAKQEERARAIEKIKLRLEEAGSGSGDEVMREYEEVRTRDEFLEREIADLERSAESLRELIKDLEEKLTSRFKEGMEKINTEFQDLFSLMFGGGTASLTVVRAPARRRARATEFVTADEELDDVPDEAEEQEEGVEVKVNLPRKKIRGLEMLSGGERALTSIALLFAMSQVNPPPFLVLDETDAALDEANSRRYGELIENLSKQSQLILITHNRETMRHAGILYGVTMGRDGASRLLSVQFDEAVAVAKA